MNSSPENPPAEGFPIEDRIGNLIDRLGNCLVKHVEYQAKHDTNILLADRAKIGLLLSLMLSSWLTVGLLIFIVFGPILEPLAPPAHPKAKLRQYAPPPADRPYEIRYPLEARNVA